MLVNKNGYMSNHDKQSDGIHVDDGVKTVEPLFCSFNAMDNVGKIVFSEPRSKKTKAHSTRFDIFPVVSSFSRRSDSVSSENRLKDSFFTLKV
ncbi:hypothetical protein BTW01_17075 [Bacillus sp. SKDU12]|nr:hypothetical protein BTW01_17075 [Bacillus sp. SKDU12]